MLMGSSAMGSMNVAVKYVGSETKVTVLQMMIFRGFFMALGCYFHCKFKSIDLLKIKDGFGILVFMRAFSGTFSSMFSFFGIFYMPLSIAIVLYYTQPISASIMNYFFNNEKLSILQIISILSAMLGVIFLSYPQLIVPS